MGQAKKRGTFSERQEAAIERHAIEDEERRIEELKREAAMTPEQKRKRHESQMLLSTILGMSAAATMWLL